MYKRKKQPAYIIACKYTRKNLLDGHFLPFSKNFSDMFSYKVVKDQKYDENYRFIFILKVKNVQFNAFMIPC